MIEFVEKLVETLFFSPVTSLALMVALAGLMIGVRQLFIFQDDSSKTQRQAKEELFKIFDAAVAKKDLFNINYLRTIKNSVERKHEVTFILNNLLEDYLIYINDRKEKDDSRDVDTVYQIIKPIMDAENEEMPFEKLPKNERRLLTNLKSNIENGDKQATNFNLNELCSVISLNNKSYLREKLLNRWSVPLAIFGLVFTLIFGITGLIGKSNSVEIIDSVSKVINSKIDAFESKIEEYVSKKYPLSTNNNDTNENIRNKKAPEPGA